MASIYHKKTDRRLSRLDKLNEQAGEKYCWARLAMIGMYKYQSDDIIEEKDSCRSGEKCKSDSINHSCWCGKFVNGKLKP